MPITDRDFKGVPKGLVLPDDKSYLVLVGPNNSRKSSILQSLNQNNSLKATSDYVSPRRFDVQNFVDITRNLDTVVKNQKNDRKQEPGDWSELPAPNPAQELITLSDIDRARVIDWHNLYFGKLSVHRSRTDNQFSSPEITIDGKPMAQQGSGSRAVLSLLTRLFDPAVRLLLIDEPEIGLEPLTQRQLYLLLIAVAEGVEGIPQKQIIIASHSHLFLNRLDPSANIIVSRDSTGLVSIKQVISKDELGSVIFRLLGNSPSDLFFPKNILIVEGPSDAIFFRKLFSLRNQPEIVCHFADGDSKVAQALPAIDQMLKTTSYISLYRNRICVAVDKLKADRSRLEEWRKFLGDTERVIELTQNGIEHYYPIDLLSIVSGLPEAEVQNALDAYLKSINDGIKDPPFGKFKGGKRYLAESVSEKITKSHMSALNKEIIDVLDLVEKNADWSK